MSSVTVGQANRPPLQFPGRDHADAGRRRLTIAARSQPQPARELLPDPVGRAREFGVIRSLLDDVARDGGALVLSGGRGLGKTTLLDAAGKAASAMGMRVVRVAGAEFEADIALAGLHQVSVPLSADIGGLPDRTRCAVEAILDLGVGHTPDRLVVMNAVLALLRHAAGRAPLMVIVDDVHWFDRASTEALAFVARRLTGSRVGVLVSVRSGAESLLQQIGLAEIRLAEIRLEPRGPNQSGPNPTRPALTQVWPSTDDAARNSTLQADRPRLPCHHVDPVDAAAGSRQPAAVTAPAAAGAGAGIDRLSPRVALQIAGAQALVAPDELAADLFRAALEIPGIGQWPFEVARVQLAFGERLRRRRATRAAREQLAAALDTFTRLGAEAWAERAGAELRATGQTRHRPDGNSPAPLTPQERGIAELAATGLTNKQIGAKMFLSPRTVSAHLYRVFPKLGITSRAALRDALGALPSSE